MVSQLELKDGQELISSTVKGGVLQEQKQHMQHSGVGGRELRAAKRPIYQSWCRRRDYRVRRNWRVAQEHSRQAYQAWQGDSSGGGQHHHLARFPSQTLKRYQDILSMVKDASSGAEVQAQQSHVFSLPQ